MDRTKWEHRKLREVCFYPNKRISISEISPNQYVGVESLLKDRGGVSFGEELPDADSAIEYLDGDILIGNIRPYLRKIWKADRYGGASGDVVNVRIQKVYKDYISPEYLYKVLSSDMFFEYDNANTHGAKMPRGDRKAIAEFQIPIPTFYEQQRIVAELDKLHDVIALKRKQLTDLDSLAQSLFYEMFGDPVVNEKGWTTKDLKEVGKITTGNTPSKVVAEYYNNSYIEWIKTDNIEQDSPIATAAKEFLSEEGCKRGRVVDEGSLLVACIAGSVESIGKSCITNRRVAFNQQINAITPNESTNIVFLYHLVRSMKKVIQDYATTGMKHILTKSAMEGITIPLPPLLLQQSFAAKITKIEAEKQRVKSSLKDLETLLASRMQYWFDN